MHDHKAKQLILAAVFMASFASQAFSVELRSGNVVGESRFSLFGFPLYHARLYTEGGRRYAPDEAFALELEYLRDLPRDQIVGATIHEMNRLQGEVKEVAAFETALKDCFRSVGKGDRFVAFRRSASQIDFYFNDQKTCALERPNIAKEFFDIWLSPNSRDPQKTRELLGQL